MFPLFETIRYEHGRFYNLNYHQARMDFAQKQHFGKCFNINLLEELEAPSNLNNGLYRCKVSYGKEIGSTTFTPQAKRLFTSLKLVYSNSINYELKYTNRDALNLLREQAQAYDEIIIVKNGLITDCSIGNLVFLKNNKWYTPSQPLLKGTQRAYLLHENKIQCANITPNTLAQYKQVGIINALLNLETMPRIDISEVE